MRPFDWNLDNVHVKRDGTILWDGEPVGYVDKVSGLAPAGAKWRAEIGDVAKPEAWPNYRAVYAKTRQDAVQAVLEATEVPS